MLGAATRRAAIDASRAWRRLGVGGGVGTTRSMSGAIEESKKAVEKAAPPGDGPNHRSVMSLDGNSIRPHVQPDAFVAPSASVIGSIMLNNRAFVLYNAVVRGDLALIHVGMYSWIGENCVLTAGEVSDGLSPSDAVATGLPLEPELSVGDFCTVGANAHLHSCTLDGDNVVGHGAIVGKGARLSQFAELRPNSWLSDGSEVPDGEVWAGSPAIKIGVVSDDDKTTRRGAVMQRFKTTSAHAYEFLPVGNVYWEKEALQKSKSSQ